MTDTEAVQRARLIAEVDAPEEVAAYDAWLAQWSSSLVAIPEEEGCGCCVLMCEVKGPVSVIATIPEFIRCA